MIEFNATFIVAMLSFVVFIMIMNAIFYKPVLNIMKKREEYINSNYSEAKALDEKAGDFENQVSTKLQQTRDNCRNEIRSIVEKAQNEATDKTHNAKEQSKSEIQTKKDVLLKREHELEQVVNTDVVKDLAGAITSKLLGETADIKK